VVIRLKSVKSVIIIHRYLR